MKYEHTVKLEKGFHRDNFVVFLSFKWNEEIISAARTISGIKWSQTNKKWYINHDEFNLDEVFSALRNLAWIDIEELRYSGKNADEQSTKKVLKKSKPIEEETKQKAKPKIDLTAENKALVADYTDWLEHKRYSPSTVKTYTEMVKVFSTLMAAKDLSKVNNEDVVNWVGLQFNLPKSNGERSQNFLP